MDPAELEAYARAAAVMAGLEIDEQWWPSVVRHLAALMERASTVESFDLAADDGSAAVFRP